MCGNTQNTKPSQGLKVYDYDLDEGLEEGLYDEDDSFEDFHKVNEFLKTIVQ